MLFRDGIVLSIVRFADMLDAGEMMQKPSRSRRSAGISRVQVSAEL